MVPKCLWSGSGPKGTRFEKSYLYYGYINVNIPSCRPSSSKFNKNPLSTFRDKMCRRGKIFPMCFHFTYFVQGIHELESSNRLGSLSGLCSMSLLWARVGWCITMEYTYVSHM